MAPHQQRVVNELAQLSQRLLDLNTFIATNPLFSRLAVAEQTRMRRQVMAMSLYAGILTDRIDAFQS